jgi:signal transduction histidine kinase
MTTRGDPAVTPKPDEGEPTRRLEQLGVERQARSHAAGHADQQVIRPPRGWRARISAADAQGRRRLARDMHDGVQNELLSLVIELRLAAQDRNTPPALARTLSALGARAQATLDSIRQIAHGLHPPLLADAGVVEALRAQATRAPMTVSLMGTAPRSSEDAEEAVYFSCVEALQNVAKHAGRAARVTLRVRHRDGSLGVRIEDDGDGFVAVRGSKGLGLTNIRDRIAAVGGTVKITSAPGRGSAVAIALPWPARQAEPTTPNAPSRSQKDAASDD